jgi:cytochrome c5
VGLLILLGLSPLAMADPLRGEQLYVQTCLVCHGDDGQGAMPGVGDLSGSKGRLTQANAILRKRIIEGGAFSDGGMTMPPLGGNQALTATDINDILQYMRKEFMH